MTKSIQAVRGMNDLLPESVSLWREVESKLQSVLHAYGYREIRLPLVEKTELFARAIGQVTDIVEKEMYTFEDRNGEQLSLRPEGTASCVRAGIEHGFLHNQVQRLWYAGPMFRHERPQKGRYRQFYQYGAEAFGLVGPDIDAELILLTARFWRELGIGKNVRLQINSLGEPQARASYRDKLIEYLNEHRDQLDEDSLRRLEKNPLRVLDSKNPAMAKIVKNAPSLLDFLDPNSQAHFASLRRYLDDAGLNYEVNTRLVRGLDYYTKTVFEWVADIDAAQNTVCAGGRYDGLVEQLGGKATPAIGFALGMERLVELYKLAQPTPVCQPHVYFISLGSAAQSKSMQLIERLHDSESAFTVICGCNDAPLKNQLRHADHSGARYAVILGDKELESDTVIIKTLRGDATQHSVPQDRLGARLAELLRKESH